MRRLSFLEKTKELTLYTERYDIITLFEISQLYGSSLCAFFAFIAALPLVVFSTQWIALPLSFIMIGLASLLFFDERLWLFDTLKRQKIASPTLKKITLAITACLETLKSWIPASPFYEEFEELIRKLNPIVLAIAAFQVGFIQSPNTSYWTIFSLVFVSLATVADDGYICLVGYLCFLIGLV